MRLRSFSVYSPSLLISICCIFTSLVSFESIWPSLLTSKSSNVKSLIAVIVLLVFKFKDSPIVIETPEKSYVASDEYEVILYDNEFNEKDRLIRGSEVYVYCVVIIYFALKLHLGQYLYYHLYYSIVCFCDK